MLTVFICLLVILFLLFCFVLMFSIKVGYLELLNYDDIARYHETYLVGFIVTESSNLQFITRQNDTDTLIVYLCAFVIYFICTTMLLCMFNDLQNEVPKKISEKMSHLSLLLQSKSVANPKNVLMMILFLLSFIQSFCLCIIIILINIQGLQELYNLSNIYFFLTVSIIGNFFISPFIHSRQVLDFV